MLDRRRVGRIDRRFALASPRRPRAVLEKWSSKADRTIFARSVSRHSAVRLCGAASRRGSMTCIKVPRALGVPE
jgi:hypothetical protein